MKKIMYWVLATVIVGLLCVIILNNTSDVEAFTFSSVDVHETKDVSSEGVINILIDSPTVDVKVQPTNGDKIEATFSGKVGKKSKDSYKLKIEDEGDTVKISMEKENKIQFMLFYFTEVSLNVKVPENVYRSIKINSVSDDITLEEVEAKEIAIETKSGDIDIRNAVTEDTLSLKTSSGDIVVNDNRSNRLDIETSSGDIRIKDNEVKEANLFSNSGDIVSDYQVLKDVKMNTTSGYILVKAEEMKGNVLLESNSGDIDVSFTKPAASMNVDYKSSSGDGTVNIDGMNYSEKSEHRIIGQIGEGNFKLTARTSSGEFNMID